MEVKADAQLGAHQRGVAKSAKGESEVARKNSDGCLEKRPTFLTSTDATAIWDGRTLMCSWIVFSNVSTQVSTQ